MYDNEVCLGAFFLYIYVRTTLHSGVAWQEYEAAVEAYHRREDMKRLVKLKATRRISDGAPDLDKDPPVFKNGGSLRDYQREVRVAGVIEGLRRTRVGTSDE